MNSKLLPLLTLSLLAALRAAAADIIWTNTAGGKWSVGANWNLGRMPGANDRVFITNQGTYTVTVDAVYAGYHEAIELGGASGTQTLTNASCNMVFRNASRIGPNGLLAWSGGTLGGEFPLAVAGALSLSGGHLGTAMSVATNGTFNITGSATKQISYLTNDGTVTWAGKGLLTLGPSLHNRTGALFDLRDDARSSVGVIINDGLLRKSAGTGISSLWSSLTNTGVLEAQTGTIEYQAYNGYNWFSPGTVFTGEGTNLCKNATFSGAIFSSNLVIRASGIFGNGMLSGTVVWQQGNLDSGASLTIAPDGLLDISGSLSRNVNGSITNAGQVVWRDTGPLNVGDGGTICNGAGATWDARSDASMGGSGSAALIVNEGLYRKSAGSGRSTWAVGFLNRGTLAIDSGTLRFSGGYTHSNAVIALAGGTLQLDTKTLWLNGDRLTGFGSVSSSVSNAGIIAPASGGGVLRLAGDLLNTAAGIVEFSLGGTTAGVNHSRLEVTGLAALGGSLDVNLANGFLPQTNDSFQVMSFGSLSGDFGCRNGCYLLGQNRRLVENSTPTSLALVTIEAPDPVAPNLSNFASHPVLVCWPNEFEGWRLLSTTNLATANWTEFPPAGAHRVFVTANESARYFRVVKP